MKIRVSYTVEVNDRYRRALNHYYGRPGLATREQLVHHCEQNGHTLDDDILFEYDVAMKRKRNKKSSTV